MSFQHLIRKPNARDQLAKFNEKTAVVLFDPKIAYEHLVDQRKTLEKEYERSNLDAVDHDQAIEEAREKAARAKDPEAYRKAEEERAQNVGIVETYDGRDDIYTGDDLDDPDLEDELAETARVLTDGDDGQDHIGLKYSQVEDEAETEPVSDGMVDYDEYGNVIQFHFVPGNVRGTQELQRLEARGGGQLAVEMRSNLARRGVETRNTDGLVANPVGLEMMHRMEEGPVGEGNAMNVGGELLVAPSDAGVHPRAQMASRKAEEVALREAKARREREEAEDVAGKQDLSFAYVSGYGYMTEAEEDQYVKGGEYAALGPQYAGPVAPEEGEDLVWAGDQWAPERSGGETPDWAKDEWIDAQEEVARAEKAAQEAWGGMRQTRSQEHRVKHMIGTLEEEFPELVGTVRCYTKRQDKRRKRETLDADTEDDGRPRKRVKTKAPEKMHTAITAWHVHYAAVLTDYIILTAFPAPPSWPCTKHGCAERHEGLLKACKHNIKACLADLSRAELKRCKVAFHPDRFHVCGEGVREEFRAMAEEVFVVVGREADKRAREEVRVEVSFEPDGGSAADMGGDGRGAEA